MLNNATLRKQTSLTDKEGLLLELYPLTFRTMSFFRLLILEVKIPYKLFLKNGYKFISKSVNVFSMGFLKVLLPKMYGRLCIDNIIEMKVVAYPSSTL